MPFIIDCAICKQKIEQDQGFLSTWGVFFTPEHRVFPYCDTGLHITCLETWPDRAEFAQGHLEMWLENHQNGYGHLLAQHPNWFFASGPFVRVKGKTNPPYFLHILTSNWPLRLHIRLGQRDNSPAEIWHQFLEENWREGLSGGALRCAQDVIGEIRLAFPTFNEVEVALGI
jgi:hypothetical protein